jgi:predicted GIY-YIG superfamily endonuclease
MALGADLQAKQDALRSLGEGGPTVRYVYWLENNSAEPRRHVGITSDLKRRLAEHNAGKSPHTSKFTPWRLISYVAFSNERKAAEFELYLKSGSGRAFANRRLWRAP